MNEALFLEKDVNVRKYRSLSEDLRCKLKEKSISKSE